MLPLSGPKVCGGWVAVGGGWWWVCKPISVLSLEQAEQLNQPPVQIRLY